uniref:Uncharacterized protein n=1 Tax=Moschus moschiferus TaxID=68415 RepID=A0A8C6DB18_MOSMO
AFCCKLFACTPLQAGSRVAGRPVSASVLFRLEARTAEGSAVFSGAQNGVSQLIQREFRPAQSAEMLRSWPHLLVDLCNRSGWSSAGIGTVFSSLITDYARNPFLKQQLFSYAILDFFFFFLAKPHGMWDLSFQTRDRTHTPCTARRRLYHWTAREVPDDCFLEFCFPCNRKLLLEMLAFIVIMDVILYMLL